MSYIVTGLLRSRTAWTSVFLDCVMHPLNRMIPEEAMKFNFADPMFLLVWEEFYDGRKIAVIDRDYASCMEASIAQFGKRVIPLVDKMYVKKRDLIKNTDCLVVDYQEFDGQALWEFIYGEGFDPERFKMLSEINMQTMPDAETTPEAVSVLRRAA